MTKVKWLLLPAITLLFGVSIYVHILTGNAGDKNWALMATKMWLNGKQLYVDIFDVNPPLMYWIYAAPVYISIHFPFISDSHALAVLGLIMCFSVIYITDCVIKYHPQFRVDPARRGQLAVLLAFLLIFYTPNNFFVDREHILLVMTFPYMMRFMPGLAAQSLPLPLRVIIGLFAAVGFCVKPYTLILFGAIQLAYIMKQRSAAILYSIENSIIYVSGALYLLIVWYGYPEYAAVVIPMALATYSAYRNNGVLYPIACLVIFGVTFVDFRPRHASPWRKDIYYFLILSAAFLLYALANNGWGYTYHPLIVMGLLLTAWVFWDHLYLQKQHAGLGLPVRPFVFGARACAINLFANFLYALLDLITFFSVSACDTNVECRKYTLLMAEIETRHIHSFGIMSGDFHKWAQLARASGATWDTRFRHLWMINKFVISPKQFTLTHQWIPEYMDHAFTEDLNKNKPDAVFVVTSMGVKLPEFFGKSDAFKAAWGHYRIVHTLNLCRPVDRGTVMNPDCRYDVYERIP